MNILIKNTNVNLKIDEESSLVVDLDSLKVNNKRELNKKRLLIFNPIAQDYELEGIWNDIYDIKMKNLNCSLIHKNNKKELTNGLSMDIEVSMPLFQLEYKMLFDALYISNYDNIHCKTDVVDKSVDLQNIDLKRVYYDNAMLVKVDIKPFIIELGNFQYNYMMRALDSCVT